MADIKAKTEELIEKLKSDDSLMESFKKDPAGAIEKAIGIDLPEGEIGNIITAVKAKLSLDKLGDLGNIGNLFGKK